MASLRLLEEVYSLKIHSQVFDSALGMNGAGRYGAQCGLVEGFLMFIGVWARANGISDEQGKKSCCDFAAFFESRFHSLLCRELRPNALLEARDLDHACEELKIKAMLFGLEYMDDMQLALKR